mmetsp:Transcript_119585/g.208213  ORF Transcript_119585/g.208213 Transcript_119585/m.208213 type:complete len:307 (-) Transcript_119585:176-1096(-)
MPAKKASGKAKEEKKEEKVEEEKKEPEIPDGRKTYVVGGWSGIDTITNAIELADPTIGDEVAIQCGTFNECVTLAKEGIAVKGVGEIEKTIITQGVKASAAACTLSAVTVEGEVEVKFGNMTLSGCVIRNGKHGVLIHAVANPTIKNNQFCNQESSAVYAFPKARGTVDSNKMVGTGADSTVGVYADQAKTIIKKNDIQQQMTGISVHGKCEGMVIQGNTIHDIGSTGIHMTLAAMPTCKANTIHSCKYYGILAEGESSPVLEKNTVTACTVEFRRGCTVTLKNNQFSGRLVDENDVDNPKLEPVY